MVYDHINLISQTVHGQQPAFVVIIKRLYFISKKKRLIDFSDLKFKPFISALMYIKKESIWS